MKLKILLVVPPEESYIGASAHQKVEKGRESRPKLGILYVATYLKTHQPDVEVKVLDCTAEDIDFKQYKLVVREYEPDLVGITAVTFTIVDALRASEVAKTSFPQARTCIGGFHATLYPRETLAQPGVDFVVFGEGEITFNELVRELKKPIGEFEKVLGLGFRRGPDLVINPSRPLVNNLDILPYPDYHLVNFHKYSHVLSKDATTLALESSRGCPFSCIFCDIRRTKFRIRSVDSIISEVLHWYEQGVRSFFWVDDNFVMGRERLLDICYSLKKESLKIDFKISARVDLVDREMLKALKVAGCARINFGVETGHPKFLDYLQKGITPQQTEDAFRLCKDIGIEAFAYMMLAMPGETAQEMYDELKYLRRIGVTYASFSVCSPYPKTALYQKLLEEGFIRHDYWQDFANNPTKDFVMPLVPGEYSAEQLRNMQANIMRKFYLSPHVIIHRLKEIRNLRQLLNNFRVGLKILWPQ